MKIVLLTGHRKSGTTMLHKLFDGHPKINIYPVDVSVLYAYFPCFSVDSNVEIAKERVQLILSKTLAPFNGKKINSENKALDVNKFIKHFLNSAEDEAYSSRDALITAIALAWCEVGALDTNLPFVIKETSQAIHFREFIGSVNNRYQLVNLVRDPRDNYAAIKSGVKSHYSLLGENELESLSSVINRSRMDLIAGQIGEVDSPESFLNIRFEDIASDVNSSMRLVSKFCNIEFDERMCIPTNYGELYEGNNFDLERFNGVSSKNVGRWKERISDFEAKVIEFWMGDVMKTWDYYPRFSKESSAKAYAEFYDWYNCRYFYHDSFA